MADIDLDGSDLLRLAREIGVDAQRVAEKAYPLVKEQAIAFRNDFRDNARATAGAHGNLYPRTITAEQNPIRDGVEWEVGPESMLPQGGMGRGFEFGSVNQPPHWDMTSAAVAREAKFNAAVDALARSFLT